MKRGFLLTMDRETNVEQIRMTAECGFTSFIPVRHKIAGVVERGEGRERAVALCSHQEAPFSDTRRKPSSALVIDKPQASEN